MVSGASPGRRSDSNPEVWESGLSRSRANATTEVGADIGRLTCKAVGGRCCTHGWCRGAQARRKG